MLSEHPKSRLKRTEDETLDFTKFTARAGFMQSRGSISPRFIHMYSKFFAFDRDLCVIVRKVLAYEADAAVVLYTGDREILEALEDVMEDERFREWARYVF